MLVTEEEKGEENVQSKLLSSAVSSNGSLKKFRHMLINLSAAIWLILRRRCVGLRPRRLALFGKKEGSCLKECSRQTLQAVDCASRMLAEDFLTLCPVSGHDSGDLGAREGKAGARAGMAGGWRPEAQADEEWRMG